MQDERPKYRAKKSLGQNFLIDQNICHKIVNAINPGPDDHIIEIGPGRGALTEFIVEASPKKFTVIEMDSNLADRLEEDWPTLNVVRADALKYPWEDLNNNGPCKIIGNLPYNIGSKLIWDIVSKVKTLEHAIFMVQHEVALRLTAQLDGKAYGALTAWVNNFAETRYLFKVPPTVFRPRPKVDSAVVGFKPLPLEQWPANPEKLSELIKLLFQKRRKQMSTILKKQWTLELEQWFEKEGVSPQARPENISPKQLLSLSKHI
ncbi:MAG: ribosomal RNA small subunit methyltransferase A [Pseudodesulfovibrio sp.]|nr:ribosomal RNA small subunit methyltransferase A [Pseudodesulfovibrio sp.]